MNLKTSVIASGGIGALLSASALWPVIIGWMGLPPDFLTMPTTVKALLLIAAIAGLIANSIKTSKSNPDGTPAEQPWR